MPRDSSERETHSPRALLGFLFLLALASWGGVLYLIANVEPTSLGQLLFFALLFVAVLTTSAPLSYGLHARRGASANLGGRALRQAIWVALFVVLGAWLQVLRVLTWYNALLILAILVLVELLIRQLRA